MVETSPSGNTLLRPPRRSGSEKEDVDALFDWLTDLFSALVLEQNTIGGVQALDLAVTNLQERVKALEARIAAAEARLAAIGNLSFMPGTVSGTYVGGELAQAYTRLNQIIVAAKG
jgi:hypothetical protein